MRRERCERRGVGNTTGVGTENEIREPRFVAARSATLLLLALLAMLFADKRALETNLKVGLLQIREKELNFYTQNCLAVCTQAALLAGFAYSGLTQVSIPEEANFWVRLLYISVTVMAMCFEIIAVLNTTLLAIVGPGLALRGPDGSMHPAVDGMMAEYKHALSCFKLGLVCFHLSAGLFGWIMFGCAPPPAAPAAPPAAARAPRRTDPPTHHHAGGVALCASLVVLVSLYFLLRYAMRVYQRFRLPTDEVVTGRFEGSEVLAASKGDDLNEQQCLSGMISQQSSRSAGAGPSSAGGSSSRDGSQRGTPTPTSSSSFPTGKRALGHALGIAGGGAAQ